MSLRIGFDMDGVLADFAAAFHDIEARLFGHSALSEGGPDHEEEIDVRESRRRRDRIWQEIESTENFWLTLPPIDPAAVRRIHELTLRHKWEVFFITQRPRTDGETVQRQTQHWLAQHGFDLPSVLVLGGSRGSAAVGLRLDYLVDDSAENCLDVVSQSTAKAILVVPDADETAIASARKLGIGTAQSIAECLDVLEKATIAQTDPGLLARIAAIVGWNRGET